MAWFSGSNVTYSNLQNMKTTLKRFEGVNKFRLHAKKRAAEKHIFGSAVSLLLTDQVHDHISQAQQAGEPGTPHRVLRTCCDVMEFTTMLSVPHLSSACGLWEFNWGLTAKKTNDASHSPEPVGAPAPPPRPPGQKGTPALEPGSLRLGVSSHLREWRSETMPFPKQASHRVSAQDDFG